MVVLSGFVAKSTIMAIIVNSASLFFAPLEPLFFNQKEIVADVAEK